MRRPLIAIFAAILLLAGTAPAVADEGGGTYLALGDSVAAGTQQPLPFTANGYTSVLAGHLATNYGIDNFVNLACPGDDTVEMVNGDGSLCYGAGAVLPPGGASQLQSAVDYLVSHPGEVELITLVIGANDILACDPTDPDVATCVATQLGQIGANLPVILGTLQAVAPGVPIVAMNYYNPNLAFWLVDPALADAALALSGPFNGTLEAIYGAFGVPVADVETAFKTYRVDGKVPTNVRAICLYTLMCEVSGGGLVLSDYDPVTPGPQTDIHPSNLGYQRIAGTHFKLIEDLGLLA
jgi:lysophospholipase L1-like esterase